MLLILFHRNGTFAQQSLEQLEAKGNIDLAGCQDDLTIAESEILRLGFTRFSGKRGPDMEHRSNQDSRDDHLLVAT